MGLKVSIVPKYGEILLALAETSCKRCDVASHGLRYALAQLHTLTGAVYLHEGTTSAQTQPH